MPIACLHTAESNIAVFEAAARALALPAGTLSHAVRAELLAAAERAGGLTPAIAHEASSMLLDLGQRADAVILTCSTLGPAAAAIAATAPVPVLRTDVALAERAVASGRPVVALCAVETTLAPTTRLFAEAAARTGAEVEVRLVPDAWALFRAGDQSGYLSAIAEAAEAAYDEGAAVVALAQASMAAAADLVRRGPRPLDSPTAGLAATLERLRAGART